MVAPMTDPRLAHLRAALLFLSTPSLGRSILALLTVALVVLTAAQISTVVMSRRAAEFHQIVDHSEEIRLRARDVLNLLIDAETGQRGYILTGRADHLAVHHQAVEEIPQALDVLSALTRDAPAQAQRVADLRRFTTDRLEVLRQGVAHYEAGRPGAAVEVVRTGRGAELMEAMRLQIAAIDAAEARRLIEGRRETEAAARNTVRANFAAAIGILLLGGASLFLIRRYVIDMQRSREIVARMNEGLEAQVRERTAALTTANEEIQRFAYIVSHDLRAPLVNVMGYTAELEGAGAVVDRQLAAIEAAAPQLVDPEAVTVVREEMPEAIGFIRASTAKMDRLIKAILNLSRQGRRHLVVEPLDVTAMVRQIADSVAHQVNAADGRIDVAALPEIESDRIALEQVFGNLIDNAVKYLDPARPGRIAVTGEDLPDGRVAFAVSDNGRGVSPSDHERIFELFRRAGRQDRQGEGLGLAFVRNNVRRLGGTISIESELGKGSTFHLELPKRLIIEEGDSA